jgi:UDP-glucose 4-epimerase
MARVEDAARGKPITMPQAGALADWTYGMDAAKSAWLALDAPELPHRLYNAGTRRQPVGEFTAAVQEVLPNAEIVISDTELPGNAHAQLDSSRIQVDLGYQPDYSLADGVRDYVERVRLYDAYAARTTA